MPHYIYLKSFSWVKPQSIYAGVGINPEHLNDDRLGRVLDKLYYEAGLTQVFVTVAMAALSKFGVKLDSLYLDSSSFHVHGEYASNKSAAAIEPTALEITYGYSRDHRLLLKQFIMDLMCSGDGDVPLYLRVANGNESDCAMFATILKEFRQQWQLDALFVADAAIYSEENIQQMNSRALAVTSACNLEYFPDAAGEHE